MDPENEENNAYKTLTKDVRTTGLTARLWQYSIKVEINAKGFVQPSVHVYDDIPADACDQAVNSLVYLVQRLTKRGFKVATSVSD